MKKILVVSMLAVVTSVTSHAGYDYKQIPNSFKPFFIAAHKEQKIHGSTEKKPLITSKKNLKNKDSRPREEYGRSRNLKKIPDDLYGFDGHFDVAIN